MQDGICQRNSKSLNFGYMPQNFSLFQLLMTLFLGIIASSNPNLSFYFCCTKWDVRTAFYSYLVQNPCSAYAYPCYSNVRIPFLMVSILLCGKWNKDPQSNRYVRQNRRWEVGDIFAIELCLNMRIKVLSQRYLHVTSARDIWIPYLIS